MTNNLTKNKYFENIDEYTIEDILHNIKELCGEYLRNKTSFFGDDGSDFVNKIINKDLEKDLSELDQSCMLIVSDSRVFEEILRTHEGKSILKFLNDNLN